MPYSTPSSAGFPKLLTPAGGMILSIVVGSGLWGALVLGIHAAGVF